MKFILIIWVCSFLGGTSQCYPPLEASILYDSWYECSRNAQVESMKLMSKMGYKYVNDYRVGTRYTCKVIETY